jgi:hypothetical protein
MLREPRELSQGEFTTAEGLRGARATFEHERDGRALRQTYYFFGKGARKFVVTCSALAGSGERLDPVFEASMKTFRFDGD